MSDIQGKAVRSKTFLDSDEWKEAWEVYRTRVFSEIERAPSNDVETVMHLKRLLAAATAAKSHLESIVTEGSVAAEQIRFNEQQKKFRLFKAR